MKTIKLNPAKHNKEVIVDDEDFEIYNVYAWNYGGSYARRKQYGKMIYMHRLIVDAPRNFEVDHINGNKLDNRKVNLRVCNRSQNQMNKVYPVGQTGFRGVRLSKNKQSFMACIKYRGRQLYLGTFNTAEEASKRYEAYAKTLRGEFSK